MRERRRARRKRAGDAWIAAAMAHVPGPDEYVMYGDPDLNPIVKRLMRETRRKRLPPWHADVIRYLYANW